MATTPTPRKSPTLPALAGALAGAAGVLVLRPGSITEEEARAIARDAIEVRAAASAFETAAGKVRWTLDQGEADEARESFKALEPLWDKLERALSTSWANWRDFYFYDREDQASALDDVPNEVVELVQRARAAWVPGTPALVINLPAGDVHAFTLGVRDRRDEVDVRFLGNALLQVRGSPHGTRVLPLHDEDGWGATIQLQTDGVWGGRVYFEQLDLLASGGNVVATSSNWGSTSSRTPYKDVRFVECQFFDHPLERVHCIRPISANHAAVSAFRCYVDMPRSREHWIYSRNPYNADTWIEGNQVDAVGGQVLQYVSRPSEGPSYGRSTVHVRGNLFRGYHRCGDRAAYALTIAGSGQDWVLEDNVVMDLDPPAFWNGQTGGALVAWDGGTFWTPDGLPVTGEHAPGVHANGRVRVVGNVFVQPNSNRPVVALQDAEEVEFRGNAVYGRNVELWQGNVGLLAWAGNDGPAERDLALQAGAPAGALVSPPMRGKEGQALGDATATLAW